jgi:photosystem II stability/assembly factor-like uncharacterized protein/tetratricopeptide (TPR) repeat protein
MAVFQHRYRFFINTFCMMYAAALLMISPQISAQDREWVPVHLETDKDLRSVWFIDRLTGWVAGDDGAVFHTSDGGSNWTRQNSRTTERLNRVFFFDEYTGWIAADNNLVLATQNGGQRWTERRPSPVTGQHIQEIRFTDWKRGWSAGGPGGHIYHTDNRGLSWQRQANLSPDATITSLDIRDHQTASVITGSRIYHTDDGGLTWGNYSELSKQEEFSAVHHTFLDDSAGVVIGNHQTEGTILRTSDGGKTWAEISRFPGTELRSLAFSDDQTGYITGTGGTLLISGDAGHSWSEMSVDTEADLNAIHFSDPGCGWIAGENGTLYRLCDSNVPGITYYKNRYPAVQISDEAEVMELIERIGLYGNAALERDSPEMRAGYYGRMLAAMDSAEQFFDGDREDVSAHFKQNRQYFWGREYNAGAELFNRSLEPGTDQNEVHALLETSKIHFRHAASLLPDSTQSLLSLATVHEQLGDIPAAITAMEQAVGQKEDPEIDHYKYLADLYLFEGRRTEAIEISKQAAALHPDETAFYEVAADLHLEAGEIDEALTYLDSLIDLQPQNPDYRYVRGNQLRELAVTNLDAALELYEEVWERRERLEVEELSPEEKEILKREVDDRMERVSALKTAGTDFANRAAGDLEKALEINPGLEEIYGELGVFFYNRASFLYEMQTLTQDPEEARRFAPNLNEYLSRAQFYLERAVETDPGTTYFWEALYNTYLALGMTDEAHRLLDEGRL